MPPIPPTRSPSLSGVLDSTKSAESAAKGAVGALDSTTKALLEAIQAIQAMPDAAGKSVKATDAATEALKQHAKATQAATEALGEHAEAAEDAAGALGTLEDMAGEGADSLDDFSKELKKSQSSVQRFTKNLAGSFGKLSAGALKSLTEIMRDRPGASGIGPSSFGRDAIDRGIEAARNKLGGLGTGKAAKALAGMGGVGKATAGALGGLGRLARGPQGLALELGVRGALAGYNERRDAVVQMTQRSLNYGFAEGDLGKEINTVSFALSKAGFAAAKFNGDLEASRAVVARMATQTGASFKDIGDNMEALERLRFIGLGSIEELSDSVVERMNLMGMTFKEAVKEMEDISYEAVQVRASSTDNFAISMDDFHKAVRDVAGSTDALSVSQLNIAKAMRVGLTAADKLNLSYTRGLKAAQGLTTALASNYSEGFRTAEIYEDLEAAIASGGEMAEKAKQIKKDLAEGRYTEVTGARFLQESGFGTSEAGFLTRAKRIADQINSGASLEQVEANFDGMKISEDVYRLLREISPQLAKGNVKSFADLNPQSAQAKAGLDEMAKTLAQAQADPQKLMDATLGGFTAALGKAFEGPFDAMLKALGPITDLANRFLQSDWLDSLLGRPVDEQMEADVEALGGAEMEDLKRSLGTAQGAQNIIDRNLPQKETEALLKIHRKRIEEQKKKVAEAAVAQTTPVEPAMMALRYGRGSKQEAALAAANAAAASRATTTVAEAARAAQPPMAPQRATVTPSQASKVAGAGGGGMPQVTGVELTSGPVAANGMMTGTATVIWKDAGTATKSVINRSRAEAASENPRV
jgi:KaiC/GvpD/RAD55 family RecA-like ATPase